MIKYMTLVVALVASFISADKMYGADKVITIGIAGPFTGPAASYGVPIKNATELFVESVNKSGGIGGYKLSVVYGDDQCDAKQAAQVAKRMVSNKKVTAIVGHFCSSSTLAAAPIYARRQLVVLSAASSSPKISDEQEYGRSWIKRSGQWVFRTANSDTLQGPKTASYYLKKKGYKRIGVIYDNDDYGKGLADSFVGGLKGLGTNPVAVEAYTRGTKDFASQLTKINVNKPDLIYISGLYEEVVMIVKQARKLGYQGQIAGGDGAFADDTIKIGGKSVEGLMVTLFFHKDLPSTAVRQFVKNYADKYKIAPDQWAGLQWDALLVISKALEKLNKSTNVKRLRVALRNQLQKMHGSEGVSGVTGINEFDLNGDVNKSYVMGIIKNGKLIPAPQQM